ncbi:MAG: hypothetical protein DWQ47_11725 [Acidobacteria bacterium]|nr:MAG: hypothetical protein DWQ32_14140 [Acidobacteriota bacterium]REJ98243.1 MAG: hypothetical protein DWQ38_16940 [Acidobacteriota bacterium]REK16987.1 MAG: hypothetical protein DWQ43_01985 [Acidobacteriota bacterium]REK42897.1 MAG: hypothetical protein DWQ47_11725 [Acidobacteriota bacterium]
MSNKRKVEIFSAGCDVCDETIALVNRIACESCEVEVLDVRQADAAKLARDYGVNAVPTVVIDGKTADCCTNRGPSGESLRAQGLGLTL